MQFSKAGSTMFATIARWFERMKTQRDEAKMALHQAGEIERERVHGHTHSHFDGVTHAHGHDHAHADHDHQHDHPAI